VSTSNLNEPLKLSHSSLLDVHTLERRFLPLPSIFQSLSLIVQHLKLANTIVSSSSDERELDVCLNYFENAISAYSANGEFLLHSLKTTRELISETLTFKDQHFAKRQSSDIFRLTETTARDSGTIRVITLLTLFYLPSSFIAVSHILLLCKLACDLMRDHCPQTVMGMNFFAMDPVSHHVIVSPQFWVYFSLCIPLTGGTFLLWRWRSLGKKSNSQIQSALKEEV
jgi:hypothetical protein